MTTPTHLTKSIIALWLTQACAQPALAFERNIGNIGDLRAAILDANADPGADIINLTSNIIASSASTTTGNALPFTESELTINGNGYSITRDAPNNIGANQFRIMAVLSTDLNNPAKLTLNNLTLQGGYLSTFNGGGLFVGSNATATLTNVTITDNAVSNPPDGGGGLFSEGTVTITGSTITNNSSGSDGGGILINNGLANISSSSISGNSAQEGGGIAINGEATTLTLNGGSVSSNTTYRSSSSSSLTRTGGGGIYSSGATLIANGTLFENNSSSAGGAFTGRSPAGGAISLVISEPSELNNINVIANHAAQGGGLYILRSDGTTITNSTISGNTAQLNGGGAYSFFNRASGSGVTLSNVDFTNNQASGEGGGIHIVGDILSINGGIFSGNSAALGGGLASRMAGASTTSVVSLLGVQITNNYASTSLALPGNGGGGMRLTESLVEIEQSLIANNSAAAIGGGLNIYESVSLSILDTTLSNNTASSSAGGAQIHLTPQASINSSTISNNSSARGGGLNVSFASQGLISNSTISGNTVTYNGGGIHFDSANDFTMRNTTVVANHAGLRSGGLFFDLGQNMQIVNSIVSGNTHASNNRGREISTSVNNFYDNPTVLTSASLVGSTESTYDQAFENFSPGDQNGNIMATSDNGYFQRVPNSPIPLVDIVEPLSDNGGPTLTHALKPASPAIQLGICVNLSLDQRGEPRPRVNGYCDAGAFELMPITQESCFVIKTAESKVVTFCL